MADDAELFETELIVVEKLLAAVGGIDVGGGKQGIVFRRFGFLAGGIVGIAGGVDGAS